MRYLAWLFTTLAALAATKGIVDDTGMLLASSLGFGVISAAFFTLENVAVKDGETLRRSIELTEQCATTAATALSVAREASAKTYEFSRRLIRLEERPQDAERLELLTTRLELLEHCVTTNTETDGMVLRSMHERLTGLEDGLSKVNLALNIRTFGVGVTAVAQGGVGTGPKNG